MLSDPIVQQDFELESQVQQAVQEYGRAESDSDRAVHRKKVEDLLNEQFALRQKRREQEIVAVENQLKKLRDTLRRRAGARAEIIQQRLNELLNDADGLGWGDAVDTGEDRTARERLLRQQLDLIRRQGGRGFPAGAAAAPAARDE
jgi:hypothetical protein